MGKLEIRENPLSKSHGFFKMGKQILLYFPHLLAIIIIITIIIIIIIIINYSWAVTRWQWLSHVTKNIYMDLVTDIYGAGYG
jgi:ABC-type multidrug transport system permease subunit